MGRNRLVEQRQRAHRGDQVHQPDRRRPLGERHRHDIHRGEKKGEPEGREGGEGRGVIRAVNDGITLACQNNGATTWTYNQGVILGGLAALSEITGDRDYLTQGEAIAAAALRGLAPGGILAEPCESGATCNEDQAQFKGIFVRYLHDFWRRSRTSIDLGIRCTYVSELASATKGHSPRPFPASARARSHHWVSFYPR